MSPDPALPCSALLRGRRLPVARGRGLGGRTGVTLAGRAAAAGAGQAGGQRATLRLALLAALQKAPRIRRVGGVS